MEKIRPRSVETSRLFSPLSKYVCFSDENQLIYYSQGISHLPGKVHASLLYWPDNQGYYLSQATGIRYNKIGQEKVPKIFSIYVDYVLSEKNPDTGNKSLYVPEEQITTLFDSRLDTALYCLKNNLRSSLLINKVESVKSLLKQKGISQLGVFGDLATNIWPTFIFSQPEITFIVYGAEDKKKMEEINKETLHKVGLNRTFTVGFVD